MKENCRDCSKLKNCSANPHNPHFFDSLPYIVYCEDFEKTGNSENIVIIICITSIVLYFIAQAIYKIFTGSFYY